MRDLITTIDFLGKQIPVFFKNLKHHVFPFVRKCPITFCSRNRNMRKTVCLLIKCVAEISCIIEELLCELTCQNLTSYHSESFIVILTYGQILAQSQR